MLAGAWLSAAIEVLQDVEQHHRPIAQALADWGRSHRFAGSGDRAAIGNLVYDAVRRRASIAARMGADSPRALAIGAMAFSWGEAGKLAQIISEHAHAPDPLSEGEQSSIVRPMPDDTPPHVRADVPEWLWPDFVEKFEDKAEAEGEALACRAPIDLRVNGLKSTVQKVLKALPSDGRYKGISSDVIAPACVRIPAPAYNRRAPHVQAEGAFQKGWFEVQDLGSQIISHLVFAQPGEQILDYCAGAGGKTLALADHMQNKGQLYAFDSDKHRLAPIYERLKRAGVRNVQVREPASGGGRLDDLIGCMHRVVIDAPCTGSGVWRRRPDAKWRLTQDALEKRIAEQQAILDNARDYVRPGGYLCYMTCSVLTSENEAQVYDFLSRNPDFELVSCEEVWRDVFAGDGPAPWSSDGLTVTLTPASTASDGFFFAVMERRGAT